MKMTRSYLRGFRREPDTGSKDSNDTIELCVVFGNEIRAGVTAVQGRDGFFVINEATANSTRDIYRFGTVAGLELN